MLFNITVISDIIIYDTIKYGLSLPMSYKQ